MNFRVAMTINIDCRCRPENFTCRQKPLSSFFLDRHDNDRFVAASYGQVVFVYLTPVLYTNVLIKIFIHEMLRENLYPSQFLPNPSLY